MNKNLDLDFFENIDEMMNRELKDVKADNFTYDQVVNDTLDSMPDYGQTEDNYENITADMQSDEQMNKFTKFDDSECPDCGGSGIVGCEYCNDGNLIFDDGCPECGDMAGEPCSTCNGSGENPDADIHEFEDDWSDGDRISEEDYSDDNNFFDESVTMINKKNDYKPNQRTTMKKVKMKNSKKIKIGKKYVLLKTSMKENEKSPADPITINEDVKKKA